MGTSAGSSEADCAAGFGVGFGVGTEKEATAGRLVGGESDCSAVTTPKLTTPTAAARAPKAAVSGQSIICPWRGNATIR